MVMVVVVVAVASSPGPIWPAWGPAPAAAAIPPLSGPTGPADSPVAAAAATLCPGSGRHSGGPTSPKVSYRQTKR